VWRVVADSISFSTLGESYRDGWLCFERLDGSDRRRLSMTQVPDGWDSLSDDRLDLLRRTAEPAGRRSGATGRVVDGTEGSDTGAIDRAKGGD
jgi:hypothetical protein